MLTNKTLITISGLSKRTYYRRLQELKNQQLIADEKNYYMEVERAEKIAVSMGFKELFEKYINNLRATNA